MLRRLVPLLTAGAPTRTAATMRRGAKTRSGPDVETNILAPGSSVVTHIRADGFVVDGYVVKGSLAVWNGVFMRWLPHKLADITPDSLALFPLLNPPLEILVVGTGDQMVPLPPAITVHLKAAGISVEVQNSTRAAATYNFLAEEGRAAAAVLLPVSK